MDQEGDGIDAVPLRLSFGPQPASRRVDPQLAGVLVFLTDLHGRFTYPDGTSEEIQGQPGQVLAMPATTHLPENLSDQPFAIILVELKA